MWIESPTNLPDRKLGLLGLLGLWTDHMSEKRELRSWRERLATPLKGSGDEIPDKDRQTNHTNPQTPHSLRVGLLGTAPNIPKQTSDPCVIAGCSEPIAEGDIVYCVGHRRRADDGTLWAAPAPRPRLVQTGPTTWVEADWCKGLCVNCEQRLAPGDVIACSEHRAAIDALVLRALD